MHIKLHTALFLFGFHMSNDCVLSLGCGHSVEPRKHNKKCVFGVFLNLTRIALVRET